MATTDPGARARQLVDWIAQGKILEAMEEFYDENVAMQENANEPMVGLANNVEREKQFLRNVKEFKGFDARAVASEGDVAFVESVLEFIDQNDQPVRLEQVSVTRWKDGKIVHERFYYDSAK